MQRKDTIIVRNDETDVLKLLTVYAKNQGSKNPEKLYIVYTKLVYKILEIESGLRGQFNASQLSIIATLEILIAQTVIELMQNNIHYKIIYVTVKQKLISFKTLISIKKIYVQEEQLSFKIAS